MTESQQSTEPAFDQSAAAGEEDKHLVFRLADEFYGTPLVAIREITRPVEVTPVPYMVKYFRGIINLRGQIVSVVDLRTKLDLTPSSQSGGIFLVVDTGGGPIAAVVDDVISVSQISPKEIEGNLAIRTKIPVDFFLGVAKVGSRLVNLINIAGTLTADDFATVRRASGKESIINAA